MSRYARRVLLVCAVAVAVAGAAGCGGGSSGSRPAARERSTTTGAASRPGRGAPPSRRPGAHAGAVRVRLPGRWHVATKQVARRNWPVPLKIAASFPIHRVSGNASCPRNILRRFPPDGVYLLVAEFTRARPPGIPPRGPLPPRGDLRHLDIRPSEVECWEGLSGAKDFTENGRSFRVEILLGTRVSVERRRQALEALGSLRIPPARP